jgi:hypothetical protein
MKTSSLLVASVVLFGLVACSSGSTGSGTSGTSGTSGSSGSSGSLNTVAPSQTGTATCDDACAYYLQCKGAGWYTQQNQSTCVQQCAGLGATPAQLATFVSEPCGQAVCTIEGSGAPGCGGSASSSGGTTTSSSGSATDCNGCVWDGGSCIYLTGSGGNYFACATACCPGH